MLALPQKGSFVAPDPLSVYPGPSRVSVQQATSRHPLTALLFFTASFQPEQPAEVAQPGHAAAEYWQLRRGHNLDQRGGELAFFSISSSQHKLIVKLHPRATRYNMIWGTDHFVLGNRRLLMGLSCCCSLQWSPGSYHGLQLKLLMIIAFGMI